MDDWSRFWVKYPKKVAKQEGKRRWDALIKKGVKPARIMAELSKYIDEIVINKTAKQYIANPATWLNREDFSGGDVETLPIDMGMVLKAKTMNYIPPRKEPDAASKARVAEMVRKAKRGIRVSGD